MSDTDRPPATGPLSDQHATAWRAYHNAKARLDESTHDREREAYWEGELRYWEERLRVIAGQMAAAGPLEAIGEAIDKLPVTVSLPEDGAPTGLIVGFRGKF